MLVFMTVGAALGAVVSMVVYELPPPYQTRVVLRTVEEAVSPNDELAHRKHLREKLDFICEVLTEPKHQFWVGRYSTGFEIEGLASLEADYSLDPPQVILSASGSSDIHLQQGMQNLVNQYQSQTQGLCMASRVGEITMPIYEIRLVSIETKQVVFWTDHLRLVDPMLVGLGVVIGVVGFVLLAEWKKDKTRGAEQVPFV